MVAFVIGIGLFAWKVPDDNTPAIGAMLVMTPVLGFCAWLIFRVKDDEYDIRSIMFLGLATRLIGTFYRFQFPADAATYHVEGMRLSQSFRSLDFLVDPQRQVPGTGTVRYLSGLVHLVVFDDLSAAFLVWLLFSFTGTWFLYRAFVVGLPNGDRYRYAILLFLWPSLAYWPDSIGKEGWMILGIGIASYGGAVAFKRSMRTGVPISVVGLVICGVVRPHVGLIVVIGLLFAFLLQKRATNKAFFGVKIVTLAVLLLGGAVLASQTATLLKADDPLGGDDINAALDTTSSRTSQGDSAFDAATVHSPVQYPKAFVTVLFRPFPNEAHDINGLMTSAETLFLLVLFAISARRLVHLPSLVRHEPYVTYALVYTLVFVFAFSSISNFGILARQRSQLTPILLVLVCLPAPKKKLPRFGRKRRLALAAVREAELATIAASRPWTPELAIDLSTLDDLDHLDRIDDFDDFDHLDRIDDFDDFDDFDDGHRPDAMIDRPSLLDDAYDEPSDTTGGDGPDATAWDPRPLTHPTDEDDGAHRHRPRRRRPRRRRPGD
jgi:hypothetical protein